MKNSKEVQSNSIFLFEYYDNSITSSESQTNEATSSVLGIPIWFIGHVNLHMSRRINKEYRKISSKHKYWLLD